MRRRTKFKSVVGADFTSGHLVVAHLVQNGTPVPGLVERCAVVNQLVPIVGLECAITCGMRTNNEDSAH